MDYSIVLPKLNGLFIEQFETELYALSMKVINLPVIQPGPKGIAFKIYHSDYFKEQIQLERFNKISVDNEDGNEDEDMVDGDHGHGQVQVQIAQARVIKGPAHFTHGFLVSSWIKMKDCHPGSPPRIVLIKISRIIQVLSIFICIFHKSWLQHMKIRYCK